MSETPRKDFLLFQRQYQHEQEHYVSDFEDDAKLAAIRHLFPGKGLTPLVEALRGFELFIIRLGKDAESVPPGPNEHVTTLRKIDSGYFSSTKFPSREEAGVVNYTAHETVPRIADRGRNPQTTQGSNKIVAVDARNSEGDDTDASDGKIAMVRKMPNSLLKASNG